MKSFSLKEALAGARGLVTSKMLIIAGVPLLFLAVAVGFLSFFHLMLADKTQESRESLMLEAAQEAFPGAVISLLYVQDTKNVFAYTAEGEDGPAGLCVIVTLSADTNEPSFVIVAADAEGKIFLEKAYAPASEMCTLAMDTARNIAQTLVSTPPAAFGTVGIRLPGWRI